MIVTGTRGVESVMMSTEAKVGAISLASCVTSSGISSSMTFALMC